MTGARAHGWLLLANTPVALLAAMMTFYALFGLAAPEPNPICWVFGASPLLLALWLATSRRLLDAGMVALALVMAGTPIILVAIMLAMLPA